MPEARWQQGKTGPSWHLEVDIRDLADSTDPGSKKSGTRGMANMGRGEPAKTAEVLVCLWSTGVGGQGLPGMCLEPEPQRLLF